MTLLELLTVKTKAGEFTWPDGVNSVCQGWDGEIESIDKDDNTYSTGYGYKPVIENHRHRAQSLLDGVERVTREQYEAAQQPVWNGEGLPPVGVECEASVDDGESWTSWYTMAEDSGVVIFGYLDGNHAAFGKKDMPLFRPIRTEAEMKRNEAVADIASLIGIGTFSQDAESIYDAIAAGKIPGVELTK